MASAPQFVSPATLEVMHGNTSVSHMNGVKLIDLNGDGRLDIARSIYAQGTTYSESWINTGLGWTNAPEFVPPVTLEVSHGNANLNHHNGVQLIDLNGDGRLDIMQNIYALGTTYSGAWINTGSGWASAPQYAPPVTLEVMHGDVNLNHQNGVQLIDLNGDGRLDIMQNIYALGTTYTGAWINTGSGWVSAPQYAPPVTLEVMHGNVNLNHHNGVKLIDLNGDGRLDLMQHIYAQGTIYTGAWINTGSGWASAPHFSPPAMLEVMHGNTSVSHMNGVRLIDLNGDGLQDMMQYIYAQGTSYTGAWINTGSGWASAPQFSPPAMLEVNHGNANLNHLNGVQLIDVNGDGRLDMVQHIYAQGTTYTGAWINTGSGWASAPQYAPPLTLEVMNGNVNYNHHNGVQLIDLNGDGGVDYLQSIYAVGPTYTGAWLNPKGTSDLLASITNGLGVTTTLTNKPLTDSSVYTKGTGATYPVQDVQHPMYVVTETATNNGIGGQFRMAYRYAGARAHLQGRGFLGFSALEQTDLQTGIKSRSDFSQTFPYIGQPLLITKTSAGGVELARAENTLASKSLNGGKTFFPYVAYSKEQGKDLNAAALPVNETWNTYDDWGNLTQSISQSTGGFRKQTDNTYDNIIDANRWFLGRLRRSTVNSVTP